MKRLLTLVACLFLLTAHAGLTVTGSGRTFEEAKQQAFRKAIEFKVGATVLSDVETQNYKRVKDDIYVYSAGYVDNYTIIKQENTDLGVIVLMDVTVSESRIKNRILAAGNSSTEFAGEQHAAQISTYKQERTQGDALLSKVLSGFPSKAFNIKQLPYNITLDDYRNPAINISYEISWNYEFIKTLREVLSRIEDGSNGFMKPSVGAVVIMAKDPKDWIIGSSSEHLFNDLSRIDFIHDTFVSNAPVIVARFYNMYNRYIYGKCFTPRFIWGGNEGFYNIGSLKYVTIFGNTKEKSTIQVTMPLALIDKISKIELSVDAENVCKK